MKTIAAGIWFFSFWGFVAIKVAGTTFAAWSWLWLFLPIVPAFSLAVRHFGL